MWTSLNVNRSQLKKFSQFYLKFTSNKSKITLQTYKMSSKVYPSLLICDSCVLKVWLKGSGFSHVANYSVLYIIHVLMRSYTFCSILGRLFAYSNKASSYTFLYNLFRGRSWFEQTFIFTIKMVVQIFLKSSFLYITAFLVHSIHINNI